LALRRWLDNLAAMSTSPAGHGPRRLADDAMVAINAGLFDKLEAHRWPTIAAVDGPARGATGGCHSWSG
jgi:enoyl-CoA hydratase/carnithine racemase